MGEGEDARVFVPPVDLSLIFLPVFYMLSTILVCPMVRVLHRTNHIHVVANARFREKRRSMRTELEGVQAIQGFVARTLTLFYLAKRSEA